MVNSWEVQEDQMCSFHTIQHVTSSVVVFRGRLPSIFDTVIQELFSVRNSTMMEISLQWYSSGVAPMALSRKAVGIAARVVNRSRLLVLEVFGGIGWRAPLIK